MTEWADEAVVLRMRPFRECDLLLKLLCRRHGLLTVFAFGARRSRRRFCGCLDVLNSLRCRVKVSGRGQFLNLEEAVLLSGPQALRQNWQRMGLAANCLLFLEALGVNEEGAQESFALLEDLRQVLEERSQLSALLPLFFRWRLAGAQGFAPNLKHCGLCGASVHGNALFVVDEGVLHCPACRAGRTAIGTRYGVSVGAEALACLRAVQEALPSAWLHEELSPDQRRACARAIEGFVQYHLGLAWEGGYFHRV